MGHPERLCSNRKRESKLVCRLEGDAEEASIGARLQRVFLIADAKGNVKNESELFHQLGLDASRQIRAGFTAPQPIWLEAHDRTRIRYLVRGGLITDENNPDRFYVAIGRSMDDSDKLLRKLTFRIAALIPLIILSGCIMGWILAGRGLSPVMEVARTAQRITGSNLSLRIPSRKAHDELDFLIETFNRMIERLENSFRQVRQFSTDVSHELRTPITIIRGQLEVALLTAETKEQYRDTILDSMEDIEHLSHLIRTLLLLSQAETGQVVLTKARLDLASLLRDITEQFQIPAEASDIQLSISAPPACDAYVDKMQIGRMLSNLLSNAIKFTPSGGKVRTSLQCVEDQAILQVSDTGRGIEEEDLPHIFDRFYRAGNTEQTASPEKGLGLGLSFVAWIVKAHEGTVAVDSTPGKGTTFTVSLPLHREKEAIPVAREDSVEMKKA